MPKSTKLLTRLILGTGIGLVCAAVGRSDDVIVSAVTFPAPFFETSGLGSAGVGLDNVLEASAVEPIGDGRLLLVAHDKKVSLRVIETAT
jgi:hypothetical protein